MKVSVVDAFASKPFEGNPAAIVPLEQGQTLPASTMQAIAAEMKHAETAFLTPSSDAGRFGLRWFTPTTEVSLCGHATLAAAHALWEAGKSSPLAFDTLSGELRARLEDDGIRLDFPAEPVSASLLPGELSFCSTPFFTGKNRLDWLAELESEEELRTLTPSLDEIRALGMRGLILTAAGSGPFDFVSRFFAPLSGIDEDPVTGSAHCALGPYWSGRLGKESLVGFQASARGGTVGVVVKGDRVDLIGTAVTVLRGELSV